MKLTLYLQKKAADYMRIFFRKSYPICQKVVKITTLPKKIKVYTPVTTFHYMFFSSFRNPSISTFTGDGEGYGDCDRYGEC